LEGLNFFGFGVEGEMNLSKIRTIRATYERKLRDGSENQNKSKENNTRAQEREVRPMKGSSVTVQKMNESRRYPLPILLRRNYGCATKTPFFLSTYRSDDESNCRNRGGPVRYEMKHTYRPTPANNALGRATTV
jgi:hypothetical protein